MKRIAIISDIHGNLEALQSVINRLEMEKPDIWLCLGDIVGYGPFPSECIELVQRKKMICVLGNHDAGVVDKLSIKHFRNPNQKLIELTKELISIEQMEWLKTLPLTVEMDNWIAVHASPIEPQKWTYVNSAFTARNILGKIEQQLCFFGHTHRPSIVSDKIGKHSFKSDFKYMINPGSVGQSRDEDYRASCTFIDLDNWKYSNYRVEYNTEPTLTALMKLGFSRRESSHLLKL